MFKFDLLFKNGLEDAVNKQNLSDYFIREFKKQERDNFYTSDIFFPPLYQQIEKYRGQIEVNFEKEKNGLKIHLEKAKRNNLNFEDSYYTSLLDMKGVVYEKYKKEQNKVWVKEYAKQLKQLSIENVFSNGIYKFNLPQLTLIENALKKAEQELNNKPDEKYKTKNLFKLGLLFAKGEMNKYFTVNGMKKTVMKTGFSAPKIVTDIKENLGIDINEKYILASINNYTDIENRNKNIFNSLDMMTKIISHCEAEKTKVDEYFKSRLPIE